MTTNIARSSHLAVVAVRILFGVAFCLASLSVLAKPPVRIIAIGDSITQGGKLGREEFTYRWPLAQMLSDQGVCFDFIGSRREGLDAGAQWPGKWDADHEGYYGATTAFVRDKLIVSLFKLEPPDIALIHLGTNDAGGSVDADIVEPLRQIVAMLRASNPKITVLVAQIPAGRIRSPHLHYKVSRLVVALSTKVSAVVAVDHYTGWSPARDTFDGAHPNLVGQRKMAGSWYAAMLPYLQITPGADGCFR